MIRQLPDNAHLFYGSFDNSYNSDVQGRKVAVQNALNADEEIEVGKSNPLHRPRYVHGFWRNWRLD